MHVDLSEEERQLVLLSLAWLRRERPGWGAALDDIIAKLDGVEMAAAFARLWDDEEGGWRRLAPHDVGTLPPGGASSSESR